MGVFLVDIWFQVFFWFLVWVFLIRVNALGLVSLLSAAEILVCPWGDERNFRKGIVQTLNTSDLCQYLPFRVDGFQP